MGMSKVALSTNHVVMHDCHQDARLGISTWHNDVSVVAWTAKFLSATTHHSIYAGTASLLDKCKPPFLLRTSKFS